MSRRLVFILLCTLISPLISGYTQDSTEDDQDVYELTPFSVDESADVGYMATNTLSGTRFNSSLRDTSASVSVWTQEFIDDTGLTEIDELIDYSLNTVLDTDDQEGDGGNFNTFTNATAVTQRIRTRGIEATRGIDYFKAVIPDDSYKIGRYDDSRGPNGVLFGVSQAGGLINQSSLVANTYQDSGRIRYSFGTSSRDRAEFRFNKVIIEDKLAIVFAGLNQDNGHWREWIQQDKERLYAAFTWRPTDKITIRANFEEGSEHRTTLQPSPVTDRVLPWYDNFLALGLDGVTFTPSGGNPPNALDRVGVANRDGNARNLTANNGANRFTFIENDGTFYNAAGTYNTAGYDNENVAHPDGTRGLGDRPARINDQNFLPYHLNPGGPDFYRETDFSSQSVFADIQITDDWFFNIQFGKQRAIIDVPQIQNTRPEFRADPNNTQGIVVDEDNPPPANPYRGRFYFDGDYRRDNSSVFYEEIRVSTSYNLNLADNAEGALSWFGNHRLAIAVSEVDETQRRNNHWLGLGGAPGSTPGDPWRTNNAFKDFRHADYRLTVRNYIDFDNHDTWRAGSWRNVPQTVTTDRWTPGVQTSYPVVWLEQEPGNINYLVDQLTESKMAVIQSFFWDNRFVVTYGYREDEVTIDRVGHRADPVVGWVTDRSVSKDAVADFETINPPAPVTTFDGVVRTAGAVFHLMDNISLVANTGSNIGIPDFRRTVFPDGATSPPPQGDGSDFGIDFSVFDNRINGRIVYYETESIQEVVGGSQASNPMEAIFSTYENLLEGSALDSLLSRRQELRPEVNGRFRDNISDGFELRLTANITDNWRLTLNAAKTDRIVSNSLSQAVDYLGLMEAGDGLVVQGATEGDVPNPEDPDGDPIQGYNIDPGAFVPGKVIAEYIALESQLPEGFNMQNTGIAGQIFNFADNINERREIDEKRWGLRPYRFNVFTTYDFKEGLLKGWSIGGGYRWEDANIIGEENGVEFEGEPESFADFLLRYRTSRNSSFLGDGRWTFQLNVSNALNNRKIIPSRLSNDGNLEYMTPGGRGVAYARFDLPTPRAYRFTVTYDF